MSKKNVKYVLSLENCAKKNLGPPPYSDLSCEVVFMDVTLSLMPNKRGVRYIHCIVDIFLSYVKLMCTSI